MVPVDRATSSSKDADWSGHVPARVGGDQTGILSDPAAFKTEVMCCKQAVLLFLSPHFHASPCESGEPQ